jgi:tRNA C32,U32 (ribose-2'-O)-methylase TrmJ
VVWVIVFGSIGLAGAIMLICYAVWLAHKASDLFSEVEMLAVRADELAGLVSQINVPERAFQPDRHSDRTISSQIDQASAT